ncbi:MAG: ATP-binding cassette domain-containing protein [Candidatus Faecisoma sp.]|jgi:energy-coupling factor transport system ATP-binding protein|nr:ATP-binding cassette domain-containing protein [Acholeplasma sp.]MDY2892581.1 ATP-binding cassette domain-containing protein [Candidatus Faecisoma sp.]
MDVIVIEHLNFKYNKKQIFEDFNLTIKDKSFATILGVNGSGKSTLAKILLGLLKFDGYIKVADLMLSKTNVREIRKKIGIVFSNPDNQFIAESVRDDIAFTLENMGYSEKQIETKVKNIAKKLGISDILTLNPSMLNNSQKQIVALASALVHNPDILILDEALEEIDSIKRKEILILLQQLNKEGLTILNITHDVNEAMYGSEIIIIDKGKVLIQGKNEDVYKEEKIFKKLGFELPFMVELSNRLMFYDLIKKPIYDMEKMVNTLWK